MGRTRSDVLAFVAMGVLPVASLGLLMGIWLGMPGVGAGGGLIGGLVVAGGMCRDKMTKG